MISAQQIAKQYGGDASGDTANIPTPGHSASDRGTVVTVDANAPDGVVVHSFNGGDALAIKDKMRADGLLPEWKPSKSKGTLTITPKKTLPPIEFRPVNQWDYIDLDGEIRYRVKRVDHPDGSKDFPVYHQDANGNWVRGRNGDAILYRWLDIVAAPSDAVIFMAEGERKADKLAAWGYPATTSKSLPKELKSTFEGRTVAILPDNDKEGERIAKKALERLTEAGAHAFIVRLPDLPPKGDIIDWTGTPERLIELTIEAQVKPTKILPILDLVALAEHSPPPRKWALDGFIPQDEVTLFTGRGGAGKSLLAKQLSTCIASGLPFLKTGTFQATSLYITCEDDVGELHRRLVKINSALRLNMADMAGKLHISSLRGRLGNELTFTDAKGHLCPSETFNLIASTIDKTGARFVVLDNVAHLFSGNENDRSDVTKFCNLLNKLCGDTGSTILLVAHPNKAGDSYSGSTGWLNAVRSHIHLSTPNDDEDDYDFDARVLSVGEKANYGPRDTKIEFRWHDWAFVLDSELPADYQKELAATIQATRENEIFLSCLDQATEQRQATSNNPGVNHYGAIFPRMPQAKGLKKPAFERAFQRLLSIKAIELDARLWKRENRSWKLGISAHHQKTRLVIRAQTVQRYQLSESPSRS